MKNVTIANVNYTDVPSVELPQTGGGIAKFIDVSDTTATADDVLNGKSIYLADGTKANGTLTFDWMGKNPEYISELWSVNTTLDQTGYTTWTPSTTATNIIASETLTNKVATDLEHYDYIFLWLSDCNVAYNNTWTASKGSPLRVVCLYNQAVFRRPSTKANADDGIFNTNVAQQSVVAVYWCYYWSSASAQSLAYTMYCPAYLNSVSTLGFSNTSTLTPNITVKTPPIATRCSTTYFTTANAGKVDQANTTVKAKGYLYRVEAGSSQARSVWGTLDNVWKNPL